MTTEEQTREMLAEKRLGEKQREESMLNRAEAEVSDLEQTKEKARELAAQERSKEKQREESMSERAAEEVHRSTSAV